MVFLRYIAVFTLSIIAGAVIEYFLHKIASSYNLIDISGGLLTGISGQNKSDNTLGLVFVTFFGIISGLFIAMLVVGFFSGPFFRWSITKIFLTILVIGLVHSLIYAYLEYSTAVYGEGILDEFSRKLILTTAILEFVAGVLIAGISTLAMKFLILNKN